MEKKNAFTGLIRRLDTADERIPVFEVILLGKQREERQKMEQSMWELWGNYKRCNIMGVPEEKKEKKERKK